MNKILKEPLLHFLLVGLLLFVVYEFTAGDKDAYDSRTIVVDRELGELSGIEVTEEMLRRRPEMRADGYQVGDKVPGRILHAKYSRYMQRVAAENPELVTELAEVGARFTHHSSIAPTGTISLSLANNASNGIEPSFAHHYFRNVIRQGKKTKEKVDVYSFELLAYRELVNKNASPETDKPDEQLPDYFVAADDITPTAHVDIQAAAQKWIDSSFIVLLRIYLGFEEVWGLYEDVQAARGATFTVRDFMDGMMELGPVPVEVYRQRFLPKD